MEQQIRSGSNSVVHAWYREHAHPVLLPLDEEEMHLLRSMVGASRQLLHFLQLLQHALDDRQEGMDLAAVATDLQGEFVVRWSGVRFLTVLEPLMHGDSRQTDILGKICYCQANRRIVHLLAGRNIYRCHPKYPTSIVAFPTQDRHNMHCQFGARSSMRAFAYLTPDWPSPGSPFIRRTQKKGGDGFLVRKQTLKFEVGSAARLNVESSVV